MKNLQQELSQGMIRSVYLLCGEEAYLKRQYEKKIKNACISDEDTINFHQYEGKGVAIGEIIDLAQTMPFFAEKRLIVLKNTHPYTPSKTMPTPSNNPAAERILLIGPTPIM